jgi:hypothetical protein
VDAELEHPKLAAYFGIVPRVSNSNETERSARTTNAGLSSAEPFQCALMAQRYIPYLQTYYEKMKSRRGHGEAIVALPQPQHEAIIDDPRIVNSLCIDNTAPTTPQSSIK